MFVRIITCNVEGQKGRNGELTGGPANPGLPGGPTIPGCRRQGKNEIHRSETICQCPVNNGTKLQDYIKC